MPDQSPSFPPPPRLAVTRDGGLVRIAFPRRQIDGSAVRELYETAAQLMDERSVRLLIDLGDVVTVSSGVMGMLITIKKKFLSVGGQLHIVAPQPHIHEQFRVMNLHLVLSLFTDADTAARSFK